MFTIFRYVHIQQPPVACARRCTAKHCDCYSLVVCTNLLDMPLLVRKTHC